MHQLPARPGRAGRHPEGGHGLTPAHCRQRAWPTLVLAFDCVRGNRGQAGTPARRGTCQGAPGGGLQAALAEHLLTADDHRVTDPVRYAVPAAANRELRLAGYEAYRFGGHELADASLRP